MASPRSRTAFHRIPALALAIAALAPVLPAAAQPAVRRAAAPLPIAERYALGDAYSAQLARLVVNLRLSPAFSSDGKGVVYRLGRQGAYRLMYLDLATATARPVADVSRLAQQVAAAVGGGVTADKVSIEDPDLDAATGALRFSALDRRWSITPAGVLAPRPSDAPSLDAFATSPDGRFRIVARDGNLVAVELASGREVALTTDGTREQAYGRTIPSLPEILASGSEDPPAPTLVLWSPDSTHIATWRIDTRGVQPLSITQQNPPTGRYPRSFHYIYPLAGAEKLPQMTRYAINVAQAFKAGRATPVPLQVPAEAMLYPGLPDLSWDGDRIRAQWTERGYGRIEVYRADPATGAATVTVREAVKPLVTVTSTTLLPAPELGGELVVSERSGWAQLYLVRPDAPDGGTALTTGQWEVLGVDHVDAAARTLLVRGVGREADRNPYFQALYRVSLAGGTPVLLTPEPLTHDTIVSPDGRWIVDAMSSPVVPTRTVLRDARDGRIVAELGRADPSAFYAAGYVPPEPFRGVAADGTTPLYAMIFRPAHFDPAVRHPIIEEVYTGPTTTQVPTTWFDTVAGGANITAQIGAVVVKIDGRGTSRRGQAFRLPAYQNLGEVGLDDHIAMTHQMAARYPALDATRVGVYGGSAGGYDAARFILRRPAFYKVAVASSGNHDLRLDKAWWPEVSMGNPADAVWERNSNMSVAGNLRGKLMLIHGDIDDNVPVTESVRLASAIIAAGRDVDLVLLPNTTHRVVQPFYWHKLRDYFTRHLLDEAPPPYPAAPVPPPTK